MGALPELGDDGVVRFDDEALIQGELEALSRGGLIVRPARALRPLEVLELRLEGRALQAPVALSCTVVVLQPERAVLQLDDRSREAIGAVLAARVKTAPPRLDGDVLRFAAVADFRRAEPALRGQGFVLALGPLPTPTPDAFRLAVAAVVDDEPLAAVVMPHASGAVALQLRDLARVHLALERLVIALERAPSTRIDATPKDAPDATDGIPMGALVAPPPDEAPAPDAPDEDMPMGALVETPPDATPAPDATEDIPMGALVDDAPKVIPTRATLDDIAPTPVAPMPQAVARRDDPSFQSSSIPLHDVDELLPPPRADRELLPAVTIRGASAEGAPVTEAPDAPRAAPTTTTNDDAANDAADDVEGPHEAAPASGQDATEAAPDAATPPTAPTPPAGASPATPEGPEAPPPVTDGSVGPPRYGRGVVHFDSFMILKAVVRDLRTIGGFLAKGGGGTRPPPASLRFIVLDEEPIVAAATLIPTGAAGLLVQPGDASALAARLDELLAKAPPPPPPPKAAEPASPTFAPPRFASGVLTFETVGAVEAAAVDVAKIGAILAAGAAPSGPAPGDVEVRVGASSLGRVAAQLVPMADGQVIVQLAEREPFLALAQAAATRVTPPPVAASSSTATSVLTVASRGAFRNPTTPEELLRLPMRRAPTGEELLEPALPVLVRILLARRETLLVEVTTDHVHRFALQRDGGARASNTFSIFGRTVAVATGDYVVEPGDDLSRVRTKGTAKELLTDLLRGLIAQFDYDALAAPFADKRGVLVGVGESGERLLTPIALTPTQSRLVKSWLNGKHTLDEILSSPAGARAVWELIYLLTVFEALEWSGAKSTSTAPTKARKSPLAEVWEEMAGKNHFEVLGLHWSSAPRKIAPAHRERLDRYGPRSKLGSADPETAKKIVERLDAAHAVLSSTAERQQYRRDTYALKWSQQAELMLSHAKLAIYRKDFEDARDTLEAVMDFYPNPEAQAVLKQLLDAKRGAKGDD